MSWWREAQALKLFAFAFAVTALTAGCDCGPSVLFPTQCSRVRERGEKALSCPNVRTSSKDRSSIDPRSEDDADTYTVCCNFGSRECAHYVCPKGRSGDACYRD